ncbi:MAG: hypothetical protein Tsb0021_13840 [Chlamydiales bacterium]
MSLNTSLESSIIQVVFLENHLFIKEAEKNKTMIFSIFKATILEKVAKAETLITCLAKRALFHFSKGHLKLFDAQLDSPTSLISAFKIYQLYSLYLCSNGELSRFHQDDVRFLILSFMRNRYFLQSPKSIETLFKDLKGKQKRLKDIISQTKVISSLCLKEIIDQYVAELFYKTHIKATSKALETIEPSDSITSAKRENTKESKDSQVPLHIAKTFNETLDYPSLNGILNENINSILKVKVFCEKGYHIHVLKSQKQQLTDRTFMTFEGILLPKDQTIEYHIINRHGCPGQLMSLQQNSHTACIHCTPCSTKANSTIDTKKIIEAIGNFFDSHLTWSPIEEYNPRLKHTFQCKSSEKSCSIHLGEFRLEHIFADTQESPLFERHLDCNADKQIPVFLNP